MRFLAHIKPHSAIAKAWQRRHALSGVIESVAFTFNRATQLYESTELSDEQTTLLRQNSAIGFAMLGVSPTAVAPALAPVPAAVVNAAAPAATAAATTKPQKA